MGLCKIEHIMLQCFHNTISYEGDNMLKNELSINFENDFITMKDFNSLMLPRHIIPVYSKYQVYGFAIVENYIDVIIYDNDFSKNINFYTPNYSNTLGCFDYSRMNRTTAKLLQNHLIELFIDFIDRGYYIEYIIDTFYIPNYQTNYNESHLDHQILIYGYDSHKKTFLTMDYFDFQKLSTQPISFDDILLSNKNFNIERNYGIDCSGNSIFIQAFKLDPKMARCPNIEIFKQKVTMFINNTPLDTYENLYYGIQMFDILAKRLEEGKNIPIKHFAFVMSHIFLMSTRMQILYEAYHDKKYFVYQKRFEDLYKKSYILKNLYIKLIISERDTLKNHIIDSIFDLKTKYENELKSIIDA